MEAGGVVDGEVAGRRAERMLDQDVVEDSSVDMDKVAADIGAIQRAGAKSKV